MTEFWAKTDDDGNPGVSVQEHLLDVGAVALLLAEAFAAGQESQPFSSAQVAFLAAIHDIGKISPGFQRKCARWLDQNRLKTEDANSSWKTIMEPDHGAVSHHAIQAFFNDLGLPLETSKYLACILGGHHGKPHSPDDELFTPQKSVGRFHGAIDWDAERVQALRQVGDHYQFDPTALPALDGNSPFLWWLAGLTTVADWIGSDERFFPVTSQSRAAGWDRDNATHRALEPLAIGQLHVKDGLSFPAIFGFTPNALQVSAMEHIRGPGVYVLEAPMGMGKTEAALAAAYQLLRDGQATGLYFALPTQLTSNRIHLRVQDFLDRVALEPRQVRLIHANSWLVDSAPLVVPRPSAATSIKDARIGEDWFASSRRALLAGFGVGTIDQALLGVVAARHFFVRRFALAGKVVILDEVHSYDLYTGTLVDRLIETLEALGCTVIVLSATLTGARLRQLVREESPATQPVVLPPYPLLSWKTPAGSSSAVVEPPPSRSVAVEFSENAKAQDDACTVARAGGTVLWICDTVDAAQRQWVRFRTMLGDAIPLGLLHSRFPFVRREAIEQEWMARLGKGGSTRCGSVLVATQVVEQSVDLDADFLVTELAPTDMLLQRLGRLWRHSRERRPVPRATVRILSEERPLEDLRRLDARSIRQSLGKKSFVYQTYVLLRTLQVWQGLSEVVLPSDIRALLEDTYLERNDDPAGWRELALAMEDRLAKEHLKALYATNIWNLALEDEEGLQTRLDDRPTVDLLLCRDTSQHQLRFLDGRSFTWRSGPVPFPLRKAIHENLVRVPLHAFVGGTTSPLGQALGRSLALGQVGMDGAVACENLKPEVTLRYSDALGLCMERAHPQGEDDGEVL